MTFVELHAHTNSYAKDRLPTALHEMLACEALAQHLHKIQNQCWDGVSKDETWEQSGVDATLYCLHNDSKKLYIQVTRAREYDMSPESHDTNAYITGQAIIASLEFKCSNYKKRGVFTQQITLLIVGVSPTEIVSELLDDDAGFRSHFESTTCFEHIYYISGKNVVQLK